MTNFAASSVAKEILDGAIATSNMGMLEAAVEIAETEAIRHKNTPEGPLHYFGLAHLYQRLPQKLSPEARERIERKKLKLEGKESILEMPANSTSVLAGIGNNPNLAQRMSAATDYMRRANVRQYENMDNVSRTIMNVTEGIRLSREDPSRYKDALNPLLALLLLDERFNGRRGMIATYLKDRH